MNAARIILPIVLGLAALLFFWNPSSSPISTCPTHSLFGLECPGCGTTRATHHLLNLNPRAAFAYNPLFVVLGLPIAALLMLDLIATAAARWRFMLNITPAMVIALVALLLVYMLLRNLPFEALGWLRPPGH